MSLRIEDYLNSISALSTATVQSGTTSQAAAATEDSDFDSYIASAMDSTAALPSENYNDILKVMQSNKAETSGTSTSSETSGEAVSGAGSGGSGGGSSDSEDETTTEVVRINGVTYLETTTTSNGVTTVTRTVISSNENPDARETTNLDGKEAKNIR